MAVKNYQAIVYIQVEEDETSITDWIDVKDFCSNSVILDLDTEGHGNPYGIINIAIDWATLAIAPELNK